MRISELRSITGLTQRQFAEYFGIPVGTLRNWEQGISTPPDYVFQMIFTSMRRDKMINVETIKFVKMLDELAERSKNGIEPFENATHDNLWEKVFYDPTAKDEEGYKVVLDALISDDERDLRAYYENSEYAVRVEIDELSNISINIKLLLSEDTIIIKNGAWWFA